jgi:hypothetical protein
VVSTHANATHTRFEKRRNSLLDTQKRVLDGKWIHWEIAKVSDSMLRKRIHVEHRVPRADNRGLHANMARPEARARTISCAPIKGDADDGYLQFLGLRDVGQSHKGRDTREAGEAKSVERLGVRQAESAKEFRHGEAS